MKTKTPSFDFYGNPPVYLKGIPTTDCPFEHKMLCGLPVNNGGNSFQRNFAPEYNIVSGTLVGGTVIKTAGQVNICGFDLLDA